MALQGINVVDAERSNSLFLKLSGMFQMQNVNWIEVDFSEWNRTNETMFRTLKEAIFQRKKVSFIY